MIAQNASGIRATSTVGRSVGLSDQFDAMMRDMHPNASNRRIIPIADRGDSTFKLGAQLRNMAIGSTSDMTTRLLSKGVPGAIARRTAEMFSPMKEKKTVQTQSCVAQTQNRTKLRNRAPYANWPRSAYVMSRRSAMCRRFQRTTAQQLKLVIAHKDSRVTRARGTPRTDTAQGRERHPGPMFPFKMWRYVCNAFVRSCAGSVVLVSIGGPLLPAALVVCIWLVVLVHVLFVALPRRRSLVAPPSSPHNTLVGS
mmetsp:Transcript_32064/g.94360  ORF Transcript_32064/g.94360 Transcript_32064/m.94360 type:complete len:254 (-) Transcript_32064:206-967(-)